MRRERRSASSSRGSLIVCAVMAVASTCLGSCGDDAVVCEIDAVFTDQQSLDIRRAADKWNTVTVRDVRFASQGDGDWLILPASVTENRLGYAQSKRRLIRINPLTPNDEIYVVSLHELGHALGLGHVKSGVMDPDHQTTEFSDEDMAECKRAGACP